MKPPRKPTLDDIAAASAILAAADSWESKLHITKLGAHISGHTDAVEGRGNQSDDLFGKLEHTPETEAIRASYNTGYTLGQLTPDRSALEASAAARAAHLAEQEYKQAEADHGNQPHHHNPEDLIRDRVNAARNSEPPIRTRTDTVTADIARAVRILEDIHDIDDPWDAYVASVAQCRCGETGCVMATRPLIDDVPCPTCPHQMFDCDCHLTDPTAIDMHNAILDHYHRMTTQQPNQMLTDQIGLEAAAQSRAAYLAEQEYKRAEADHGNQPPTDLTPQDLIVRQVNAALEDGSHPNSAIERAADIMLSRPDIDDPWDAYVASVAQCRCGETGCAMAARPDSSSQTCPHCANPLSTTCCYLFPDTQTLTDYQTQITDHTQRMTHILTATDRSTPPETPGLSL